MARRCSFAKQTWRIDLCQVTDIPSSARCILHAHAVDMHRDLHEVCPPLIVVRQDATIVDVKVEGLWDLLDGGEKEVICLPRLQRGGGGSLLGCCSCSCGGDLLGWHGGLVLRVFECGFVGVGVVLAAVGGGGEDVGGVGGSLFKVLYVYYLAEAGGREGIRGTRTRKKTTTNKDVQLPPLRCLAPAYSASRSQAAEKTR